MAGQRPFAATCTLARIRHRSHGLALAPCGPTALAIAGLVVFAGASAQDDTVDFDPRDLSGHWDRISPIESFGDVPGGTRDGSNAGDGEPRFTDAGRARFDANKPGYGPRRQMERNDPMGRCEPLGLPRHLNTEIVSPHATFEIVQLPGRFLQVFEYRHDWREAWLDGRELPSDEELYPKWNGFSVGRWEGDTLIIESAGFDDRSWLDKLGYPHSDRMRLTESYRLIDDETLELTMTVTDPLVYAEPFTSDRKLFRKNADKTGAWDEQIYCVPAEEMSYQDLIGTGNRIE